MRKRTEPLRVSAHSGYAPSRTIPACRRQASPGGGRRPVDDLSIEEPAL